jgi:hypothetical protein
MAHDDDAVGYRRPPKTGQFKPGKSGNPKGRPKGSSNFKTDLVAEMHERITLHGKDGRSHRVTKQRAFIKLLFSSALQNEKGARSALLACMRYFGAGNEEPVTEAGDLEDLDMIRDYIERTEARIKHEGDLPKSSKTPKGKGKQ